MRIVFLILASLVTLSAVVVTQGGAFVPVKEVAPLADLEAETQSQLKILEGLLKDNASYEEMTNRRRKIPRAAGVLAVMGQAIAEHPEKSKVAGPELRDAARRVITSKSYEEAVVGLNDIRQAIAGKKTGMSEVDYPWNKLMSLHRLMEELKDRHTELRSVFAQIQKGKKVEGTEAAVHASTMAVLAVVTYADTHEVEKPEDVAEWQKYSKQFQQDLSALSRAIHKGDAEAIKELFPKTTKSCELCHENFRH